MKSIMVVALVLMLSIPVRAHRLDEYLQATRISVALDRINLAIDLTPGLAVSQELLAAIDPDGNARVPAPRIRSYAQRVLQDLVLYFDGKRQSIELVRVSFPARADMEIGEGTIQLQALSKTSALKPGHHEISFQNAHLPAISVYLVNALVPVNKSIQITRQTRDKFQKKYRMNFEIDRLQIKAQSP